MTTDKTRTIAYDYCVLATGSDATLPSYANLTVPGVFVYRNIADVNKLLAHIEKEGTKAGSVMTSAPRIIYPPDSLSC